jgi:hypothetical protein
MSGSAPATDEKYPVNATRVNERASNIRIVNIPALHHSQRSNSEK